MYKVEMTTLEIAELTGKSHKNVLRDVAKVMEKINQSKSGGVKNTQLRFELSESSYVDSTGRTLPMLILPKRSVNIIMCGYSPIHAAMVIDRIEELEYELKQSQEREQMLANVVWQVINGKAFLSQELGAKCAGINNPRKLVQYIKNNPSALQTMMENDWFVEKRVGKNSTDVAWVWTKAGFDWLINHSSKVNKRVAALMKQEKDLKCGVSKMLA